MVTSKNRTLRVRILVKAFPQASKAHEETVCCAGISEDGTELLRLFPSRFRRLPKEHQFDRFDLVQMTATKASDPRPESYRVDEASIRLIERSTLTDGAKVRIWQPFIATSVQTPLRHRCTRSPHPHVRGDDAGQELPFHHGYHGRASAHLHSHRFAALRPRSGRTCQAGEAVLAAAPPSAGNRIVKATI